MQHYRKCHPFQMDIASKITLGRPINILVATCKPDVLSPSSAPYLLVHFLSPKIKGSWFNQL